jgi:putative lumazine-binding protein
MIPRLLGACLILGSLLRRDLPAQSETATATDPIRRVVEQYLHGLKFNDTTSLQHAFWPQARLFWVQEDGQLGELTQQQWYASFRGSVGKEERGALRMAALDLARDAASVKVIEEYPGSRYTDYLSLLRIQGRWWIVGKIYTVEMK